MAQKHEYNDGIDSTLSDFTDRYSAMRDSNRYFYLQPTVGKTNHRVAMKDGSEMVMLASYSYLGLIGHPAIEAAAKAAIDEYGTGAGGVRLLTGTTDLHERMEERIARFSHREDAAVFASGYVTNMAIITSLCGPHDLVVMDKLDHASIVDGCLLCGAKWRTYRHNDFEHLAGILEKAQGNYETVLVISDSVFSMDGDIMDLPAIREVCTRYNARLMVDEAHSIGTLGETGHGIEEHFDMIDSIDIKMGTLSKTIPSAGGYVAGDFKLINYMRHFSRPFIFSAATTPAQCATAITAFDTLESEPWRVERLHAIQGVYAQGLIDQGWDTFHTGTCVVPVMIGDESKTMDLTRMLFDRGVFVCPIVHPAVPKGTERLRTCLMATHTDEDLQQVFDAFEESGKALGLI
ncbi:MAG: aminotransferase class I/II-fold pyridoxal phosphate-dependent enzyme [Coriobacteriia bacterium]|nr:aminotransferase class I/II-fold pyridoxal phosphate-dependent enzyme [Coriobacteriia bacterium]